MTRQIGSGARQWFQTPSPTVRLPLVGHWWFCSGGQSESLVGIQDGLSIAKDLLGIVSTWKISRVSAQRNIRRYRIVTCDFISCDVDCMFNLCFVSSVAMFDSI